MTNAEAASPPPNLFAFASTLAILAMSIYFLVIGKDVFIPLVMGIFIGYQAYVGTFGWLLEWAGLSMAGAQGLLMIPFALSALAHLALYPLVAATIPAVQRGRPSTSLTVQAETRRPPLNTGRAPGAALITVGDFSVPESSAPMTSVSASS